MLELLLRAGDAVLRGLGQIEASTTGGAQLGNHFLVVGQCQLDFVAAFLLELGNDVRRSVVSPCE
jgi:hypothetical protein